jgi:glycosyltransferase involved in cell wall biosynthesis
MLAQRDWLPDGQLRLMYLGRLSPEKGIENLLDALRRIDDPTVTLTIYGAGDVAYVARLKALAERLGFLRKSVFFAGHVDGAAKSAAFQTADVCVVPSHAESFCIVIAEALAHGVPVIASRGTPWAGVEEKRCGLWVDNSPESLARAIVQIRTMELIEMGKRGWGWMRAEYDWNAIAHSMLNIYRTINAGTKRLSGV